MPPAASLARQAFALALAAAVIWLVFVRAGADQAISSFFYDPASARFPLQHDWRLAKLGHTALQRAAVGAWLVLVTLALVPSRWRGIAREAAVDVALAWLVVTLLKQASAHSCPWDLERFGGQAQWFALFGPLPEHPGPGRCLPAGHPVSGFAFFGLYFALRRHNRSSGWMLLGALGVGVVAGVVQVARGAHFASHVLWTAWIAWATCWCLDLARKAVPIMVRRGASL
jgi:membrane-associated PAP2 superfamily phosphatase